MKRAPLCRYIDVMSSNLFFAIVMQCSHSFDGPQDELLGVLALAEKVASRNSYVVALSAVSGILGTHCPTT